MGPDVINENSVNRWSIGPRTMYSEPWIGSILIH
jgi:hypothetical protein